MAQFLATPGPSTSVAEAGSVKAMASGPPPQARDFIASGVEIGKPALVAAGEEPEGRLERVLAWSSS
jgi:hypothetical protein